MGTRYRLKNPIDQVINMIPGVCNHRGKDLMDTQSAITLQGFPSQQRTLIMLDGIPLNDSYTGVVQFGGLAEMRLQKRSGALSLAISAAEGGQDKLSVLNAFGRDQPVGNLLNLTRFSAEKQNFQTKMWIKMYVHGRDDCVQVMMLIFGQFFFQFPVMMVINESECADSFSILLLQFVHNKKISNHVANGF